MVSPGRPMTRLMKSRSGSSGYLNTITSPRRGSLTGSTFLPIASGVGPKTNLLTSRWSPISRLFSIDPVGILNACTTHVRTNSARITAMTIDSKYSRRTDFLNAVAIAGALLLLADLEDGEKGFLRNFDPADALHPLLAFLTQCAWGPSPTRSRSPARLTARFPPAARSGRRRSALLLADLEDGEKGFLRNFDSADALHPLLAF